MHRTAQYNSHQLRARRDLRTGAVTVEFALTAGLAFFFFFASFEFSRVAMLRGTIDNAIYEGARAGVIPGATVADVERKTRTILNTALVRRSTITVSPNPIQFADREITVRVDVPLDGNLFSPSMFFGGKTISRSIQMKRESEKFARFANR